MVKVLNSDLEFKSRKAIENEQVPRLRDLVRYTRKRSAFYKKVLGKTGIRYTDIRCLDDIRKLPITSKAHLQNHNNSFFCVEQKDVAEVVSTTGTTGKPVFITLTKGDLDRLAINEARSFYCANVCDKDMFHIAVTLDSLFMAGAAYYLGIMKLGASVFRVGMRNVKKHIQLIKSLKPTGIVTVPSFLVKLIEGIDEVRLNPSALSIKKSLLIGESIRDKNFALNRIGSLIAKRWPIELYSTYGNSEGAISFCECQKHAGSHEHPDLIISEILDEKGCPVPDGELGELALTTLQTKGMPLLRYQTGDVTFKITKKCACGRNSSRIGPIVGRKAQMMKFKGVKVYPKIIENAVLGVKGVSNYVIEALTGDDYSDRIMVKIGCKKKSKKLKEEICRNIEAHARVTPTIKLMPAGAVERLRTAGGSSRKPKVFIDKRSNISS